jgi:hypothetical protein
MPGRGGTRGAGRTAGRLRVDAPSPRGWRSPGAGTALAPGGGVAASTPAKKADFQVSTTIAHGGSPVAPRGL